MKEFTVGANDAGQRLDRFIGKAAPLIPSGRLQKAIRTKDVKVNGKRAQRDQRVCEGDVVRIWLPDEFFEKPREEDAWRKIPDPKLSIVYEDENLLLVEKKPGVLCHSAGEWDRRTLIAEIQAYLARKGEWQPGRENAFAPALCNRIDRNTGGIVIAAKNAETLRILNDKIRDREIDKYYLCVVCGKPARESGRLEHELFKDAKKNQVYVKKKPEPGSRHAVTEYRVVAGRGELSLLECRLLTGRTHQIRVQAAAAGFPLLGDGKYGNPRLNRRYGEEGQLLYSWKLIFDFPTEAGILEYLRGREFHAEEQHIDFLSKYFPGEKIAIRSGIWYDNLNSHESERPFYA